MNSKILVAVGIVLAFVMGTMAAGFYTNSSNAFNAPETATQISRPVTTTTGTHVRPVTSVPRTHFVEPRSTSTPAVTTSTNAPRVEAPKKRSWQKSAVIVGGSAGAGAAIGAVSGGKKGAAIGAVSGGVAGLVYDMVTRNKN